MVPVKKEDLRTLVTETTKEVYEELTPAQKQDEISIHMMGYVKSCTNEIIIEVLAEILGLEDEDEE